MDNVIRAEKLAVNYGSNRILTDISFSIKRGDFVGLIGPNGAGKSTLIKAVLGLIPASEGQIYIYGDKPASFRNWKMIDYLPQNLKSLNPLFPASVAEVVFLGLLSSKKFPIIKNKSDEQKVDQILKDLDIYGLKQKSISDLSGGQQQKVMIARALVSKPEVLILDEPTTALDSISRESFMNLIRNLNQRSGATVILITHDTNLVCKYAGKLMYLDRRLVFWGSVGDFFNKEEHLSDLGDYGRHVLHHQHRK